jgi:hypothetical protein
MSGKPAIADDPPWWRRQFPDEAGRHSETTARLLPSAITRGFCPKAAT